MPEKYELTSKVDEAIKKYGGDDENYKQSLKSGIREFLGYSNYLARMNKVGEQDVDLSTLRSNMTPQGVISAVGQSANMQENEMNHLSNLAKGVDTVGDSLATSQASREKKDKADLKWITQPKDWVDSEIADWVRNFDNMKENNESMSQLEERLVQQWIGEDSELSGDLTEAQIRQRIKDRVPTDLDEMENLKYQAHGYSDTQARRLVNYDRYAGDRMGDVEKQTFEQMNPSFAENAKYIKQFPSLLKEEIVSKDEDGNVLVSQSYADLANKYPNVPESLLKEIVNPGYHAALVDDLESFDQQNGGKFKEIAKNSSFTQLLNTPSDEDETVKPLRDLMADVQIAYGDVYSASQIKKMFYDYFIMGKSAPIPMNTGKTQTTINEE